MKNSRPRLFFFVVLRDQQDSPRAAVLGRLRLCEKRQSFKWIWGLLGHGYSDHT